MDEKLQKEFDDIKNCLIYLDWNVVSYLFGMAVVNEDTTRKVACLECMLSDILDRERLAIPFSNGHFLDIRQGDKGLVSDKLKVLDTISRGWMVSESFIDRGLLQLNKLNDVRGQYDLYDHQLEQSELSRKAGSQSRGSLIAEAIAKGLEKSKEKGDTPIGKLLSDELIAALTSNDDNYRHLGILRLNKKLRNSRLKLGKKRFKFPDMLNNSIDETPTQVLQKIDQKLAGADLPWKTFDSLYSSMSFLDIPFLSSFQVDIMKLCGVADILGIATEDLSKATAFQSIVNDQTHLIFGMRCAIMISEDKNLLRKAGFIKKLRQLPVRVYNIDSFIEAVLKWRHVSGSNMATSYKEQEVHYSFVDKNGGLIKEYTVST